MEKLSLDPQTGKFSGLRIAISIKPFFCIGLCLLYMFVVCCLSIFNFQKKGGNFQLEHQKLAARNQVNTKNWPPEIDVFF
jgi:hypothetical protein